MPDDELNQEQNPEGRLSSNHILGTITHPQSSDSRERQKLSNSTIHHKRGELGGTFY